MTENQDKQDWEKTETLQARLDLIEEVEKLKGTGFVMSDRIANLGFNCGIDAVISKLKGGEES